MASSISTPFDIDRILKNSDIMVACGIIAIVIMMIVPMPSFLLTLLLTINITLALIILLVTMYTQESLELSIFPSLLLITTLFRLALNVSSTRLILLKGNAGALIDAFGNFVVGGNPIVGFVIFLILIVIQFVVITKGAERVAEVAARFTLDAMPGKQMSIDADLNAGLISEQDARDRRNKIQREANFYGAMDGASKFVKGDAIAGIIITIINIIGGLVIGVITMKMPIAQAAQRFTLLTVGDGLVSQIPALMISTSTGIIVTRAASEGSLGRDVIGQIFSQPKALFIATGALLFLSMIPGLPHIPFITIAIIVGTLAYLINRTSKQAAQAEALEAEEDAIEETRKPENVLSLLQVDPMELEIGYSLIPLVDPQQGGDLLDRVTMIRRQMAMEMGLVVPPIRIRDNMQLKPSVYKIKMKGMDIAQGEMMVGYYMAMDSGMVQSSVDGIETMEPAFGLPALWVTEEKREEAELNGYTVVDLSSVIATHLTEIIRRHADEILGRQETQALIDNLKENYSAIVEELIPNLLTMGEVQKVLQNLLCEQISIRNLVTIFESLADQARATRDIDALTEYVRQSLVRQISQQYKPQGHSLPVITLDADLEKLMMQSLQQTEQGSYINIDPNTIQTIYKNVQEVVEQASRQGYQVVILCSPMVRIYFKRLVERVVPDIPVLSYNELDGTFDVQSVGMVKL